MGIGDFFRRLFGGATGETLELPGQHARPAPAGPKAAGRDDDGLGCGELARRLGMSIDQVLAVPVAYSSFRIAKRSGGMRRIDAPAPELKRLQRLILRRVLGRLRAHKAVSGFERGRSIVHNAVPHVGKAVVIRMDVQDFFGQTSDKRVAAYFKAIGWSSRASSLLAKLTTHDGCLPQGAPTSPRLSSLVNYQMDAALASLAASCGGASYSRYADDITFSLDADDRDLRARLIGGTKAILGRLGYKLHQKKKLRISRGHQRQLVTGLVVNRQVSLPRATRRRLRAIEHRLSTGGQASITPAQLAGWKSLLAMVAAQRQA